MPSLTVLDVGHGSCAILRSDDDSDVVIIDAGPGAHILEFLDQEGINRVSSVVVSHADADHLSGVVAMLAAKTCEIGQVCLNSDALQGSEMWRAVVWDLDQRRRSEAIELSTSLTEGDAIPFAAGEIRIDVLAPRPALVATGPGSSAPDGRTIRTNTISAVVRISVDHTSVALLAGDLDNLGLDLLLDTGQDIRAPLLVFPHHGGGSGASGADGNSMFARKIMDAVQPSTVIFSIGRGIHGTPHPEIVQAVRQSANVRIACTQLSEHCAPIKPSSPNTHLLPIFARGRATDSCCAGSFRLWLAPDGTLAPELASHGLFIDGAAPTALCAS